MEKGSAVDPKLPQRRDSMEIAVRQFNESTMRSCLEEDVYTRFKGATRTGTPLSSEDKDAIADALGAWAQDLGALQYAHIFYPVRSAGLGVLGGSAALKHDAFVNIEFDSSDTVKPVIKQFSAGQLFRGETDGSSFPHGGLRSTHTAGAWTSWDMTSPPYIIRDTLYIPCIFVSQYGKALDEKTPLLRANNAVSKASLRLLRLLGDTATDHVVPNVGPEQEFFIIDRELYFARPDLQCCGRTVMGASPPKGQQESLNYFSQVQPRVKQFFLAFHKECWKLGISNAVMHNEVAPAQSEFCHIFTITNVASDWNCLGMDVMNEIAIRHGLVVLLHEKPFQGLNGSGKHNNWGLFTDKGDVIFKPGGIPVEQERFMAFTACVIRAVNKHADVFRAGVASAGNDHRLGSQEAPPAIMSLYIGDDMEKHIDSIIEGGPLAGYALRTKTIDAGAPQVSLIQARHEDRNRTAPIPFCGDRFEFRAVGASQNISWPLTVINSCVAEAIGELCDAIDGGASTRDAVAAMFKENKRVIFNGNGYSQEWKDEAASRGLLNLATSVEAIDLLAQEKNLQLFNNMQVMDNEELLARQETMYEAYLNILTIEANVMIQMLDTGVIPACALDLQAYQGINACMAGEREELYGNLCKETTVLKKIVREISLENSKDGAWYCKDYVKPQMEIVRAIHDDVEKLVRRKLYPFPSYQDMLFSHHSEKAEVLP
eukprot:GEMP01008008.1.p1 GENE.GEMP01008008.1~~GEMP01008008.1.p1  ORF type:complete len:713 (+),score=181.67 GEMP01008008.1:87-2225(+)